MKVLKNMNYLQKFTKDKILLGAFISLGIIALAIQLLSPDADIEKSSETASDSYSVDTMIPAGYLLIPLELSNAESLASLSGSFSVIDLYAASEKGKKGFKVASAVKLLRAPLNPQQFAVLVKEEESSRIVTMDGPFFAALKNPQEVAAKKTAKPKQAPLVIHYGE
ncbi:hypothetical protein [Bdellovibrio sp. HCB337]|uniref:hypothetical protein n=1 Tax=Bdellovibrio sp. HCB337 TaxID=3394358 RepID=UPI0039A56676